MKSVGDIDTSGGDAIKLYYTEFGCAPLILRLAINVVDAQHLVTRGLSRAPALLLRMSKSYLLYYGALTKFTQRRT